MFYGGEVNTLKKIVIDNQTKNANTNMYDGSNVTSNMGNNNENTGKDGENGIITEKVKSPVFRIWKGELAQEMLNVMWVVSGGNKDFVLTMLAENGTFEPYRKHPNRNADGSWDYSFGLNSYYHKPMIKKILAKTMTLQEIAEYHWAVYNQPDNTTTCGVKKFCGYNRIRLPAINNQIIF